MELKYLLLIFQEFQILLINFSLAIKIPKSNDEYYSLHCEMVGNQISPKASFGSIETFLEKSTVGKVSDATLEVGLENGQRMIVDYLFKPELGQRSFKFSFYSKDYESTELTHVFASLVEQIYSVMISGEAYNKLSTPFFVGNKNQGVSSRIYRKTEHANSKNAKDQKLITGDIDQMRGLLKLDSFLPLFQRKIDHLSYVNLSLNGKYKISINTNSIDADSVPTISLSNYKTRNKLDFSNQLNNLWQIYSSLTNTRMAEAELALTISAQRPTLLSTIANDRGAGSFFQIDIADVSKNLRYN